MALINLYRSGWGKKTPLSWTHLVLLETARVVQKRHQLIEPCMMSHHWLPDCPMCQWNSGGWKWTQWVSEAKKPSSAKIHSRGYTHYCCWGCSSWWAYDAVEVEAHLGLHISFTVYTPTEMCELKLSCQTLQISFTLSSVLNLPIIILLLAHHRHASVQNLDITSSAETCLPTTLSWKLLCSASNIFVFFVWWGPWDLGKVHIPWLCSS